MDPILIGLAALMWSAHKKNKDAENEPFRREFLGVNGSGSIAFLYQLPQDSYSTTRMAVSSDGNEPQEMGIFQNPDEAKTVAKMNGWTLAHGGEVLSRTTKPGVDS